VLAAGLVVALLFAVPDLRRVGRRITHMDARWLALAVALELLSCLGYVLVFRLTFPTVEARLANRLAAAQLAFGAALPFGGVGGIAFGAWVLRREGMGMREVAERSTVLYLAGTADGHLDHRRGRLRGLGGGSPGQAAVTHPDNTATPG